MKIFIGLVEIAGYYTNLKRGFDELGVESIFVNLIDHPFQYHGTPAPRWVRLMKFAMCKRDETPRLHFINKTFWIGLQAATVLWAILNYDAFIFGFNTSLWQLCDYSLLKLMHKKIIVVSHGDDARPRYLSYAGTQMTADAIIQMTRDTKERFQRIERYADALVSLPAFSHLQNRPHVHFLRIGLPYQNDQPAATENRAVVSSKIHILHAPSQPQVKGTPVIRRAIQDLRAKGYDIDYVEIAGRPNFEVLDELARCDFIVDQMYADTPLAGFATEAAFFGKPAVIGGYAQESTCHTLPANKIPPSYYCRPEEVKSAIEKMIVDVEFRLDLGRQAQDFVRTQWSPRRVAERYLQMIRGDIPDDWLFDPKNICYMQGGGLPEGQMRALLRSVINAGGKEALQVGDKPELERALVEFAYADESKVNDLTPPDSRSQEEVKA